MYAFIILIIVLAIVAALVIRHLSAKLKVADKIAEMHTAKKSIPKNPWRERKDPQGIDHQKRKTLMPSSQTVIPKGYDKVDGELVLSKELPIRDYQFKFFGSQLLIEKRAIISGLPNKYHTIEILADGQIYVDGVEHKLIGADADSIKQAVLLSEQ